MRTALGIIAGYGLAALSPSYYARARIGAARWRRLHRFIAAFWLLGLAHTIGAGTDAGQLWFIVVLALVAGPPFGLLAARGARPGGRVRAIANVRGPTLWGGLRDVRALSSLSFRRRAH